MPTLKRWLGLIDHAPENEETQLHELYMKNTDRVLDEMEIRVEALEWDVYGHPRRRSRDGKFYKTT